MQIKIVLENRGVTDIPVNYNHRIQSAIFGLLAEGDAKYAEHLHTVAFGGKTKYKLFTFGKPVGNSHFHNKKLYFEGNIGLEIRSAAKDFIRVLQNGISNTGCMCIGDHRLDIKSADVHEQQITGDLIRIRTVTPIVAKRQIDENKTEYFSPQDVRFISRVREAFENKYEAFTGSKPDTSVDILPISDSKKVVTNYKNTWITAYHGVFQLYGMPEYLQFLYDVGLGVKTAQGFGMFDII